MKRQEVELRISTYLRQCEESKCSGKSWIEINASQGHIGEPRFFKFVQETLQDS